MHITERDWELGKNYPTSSAIRADVKETLRALLPMVRRQRTAGQAEHAARRLELFASTNWSAQRDQARAAMGAAATSGIIDPRALMMRIVDALPDNAIVVEEALTAAPSLATFLPMRDVNSFYGLASGGLGFAMPGAIGVSLAQPGRPVVAIVGDGSAMYAIQALWTAAHLQLPITYVILNNRSYRIIKERLVAGRHSQDFVGMDLRNPPLDFVSLARGHGLAAERVTAAADIARSIQSAIARGVPSLIECILDDGFGNTDS
jgi:benzoylformate decarboxylase